MVILLAQALDLTLRDSVYSDLMPSDILGSEILDENRQFKFIKGHFFEYYSGR
jgi:MoxR-like ATPase